MTLAYLKPVEMGDSGQCFMELLPLKKEIYYFYRGNFLSVAKLQHSNLNSQQVFQLKNLIKRLYPNPKCLPAWD